METKKYLKKQKSCKRVIFLCLFLFGAFSVFAQTEKPRIAVIDLTSTATSTSSLKYSKQLTVYLTTELVNTNRYRVMERSKIDEVLREQGLQDAQAINAQAVELGRLLGVHKIITGEWMANTYHRLDNVGSVNLRYIDIETGDIEASVIVSNSEIRYIYRKKREIGHEHHLSIEEFVKKALDELLKSIE